MTCPGTLCGPFLGFETGEFFFPPTHQINPLELCEEHEENLSMFCLDDLEPICKECAIVSHAGHRVYLLSEAAIDCKEELRTAVTGLKRKHTDFSQIKQASQDAAQLNQANFKLTEKLIKDEFKTLHQFLREEEDDRLLSLKKESEEKLGKAEECVDKMDELIKSLEEKIRLTETEIDSGGNGDELLENYDDRMSGLCVGDVEAADGSLINVADHLANLRYEVWKKMRHIATYTPVTVGSRTAGPSLEGCSEMNSVHVPGPLSEKMVQMMADVTAVPANCEHFHPSSGIRVHEGFDSGVHCWEAEVTDTSHWTFGVAARWVSRGREFAACPEAGLWCISLQDGEYRALTNPSQILNIDSSHRLHRIGARLNWEGGTLEFTDAETRAELFRFDHCFAEKVYPYFESVSVGANLTVSAQTVNISIDSDHPHCSNPLISGEDEETEDDTSHEIGVISAAGNGKIRVFNGSFTDEKKLEMRCMKEEKRKQMQRERNTSAKRQTGSKRFDVTYHVALNRALSMIVNNNKHA